MDSNSIRTAKMKGYNKGTTSGACMKYRVLKQGMLEQDEDDGGSNPSPFTMGP